VANGPPKAWIDFHVDQGLSDQEIDYFWSDIEDTPSIADYWRERSAPEKVYEYKAPMQSLPPPDLDEIQEVLRGTFFEGMDLKKAFASHFKEAEEQKAAAEQWKKGRTELRETYQAEAWDEIAKFSGQPFLQLREAAPAMIRLKAPAWTAFAPKKAPPRIAAPLREAAQVRPITAESRLQMSSTYSPPTPNQYFSSDQPPEWYGIGEEYERATEGPHYMRNYPRSDY
jgi:hypothetical protein